MAYFPRSQTGKMCYDFHLAGDIPLRLCRPERGRAGGPGGGSQAAQGLQKRAAGGGSANPGQGQWAARAPAGGKGPHQRGGTGEGKKKEGAPGTVLSKEALEKMDPATQAIVKQLQEENTATKAEAREARQMAKELKEGGAGARGEGGQEEGERRED